MMGFRGEPDGAGEAARKTFALVREAKGGLWELLELQADAVALSQATRNLEVAAPIADP